jgi:ABC-type glycerol-3-phosphate transport system permease component
MTSRFVSRVGKMAAAALITLPVLLVGLLAQRYLLQGLQFTGAELRS